MVERHYREDWKRTSFTCTFLSPLSLKANMASASLVKAVASVLLLLGLLVVAVKPSEGAVFTVGDSIGWTILNSPNYTAWVEGKTFHIGDTILFVYNKQYHNVMVVSQEDYRSCSASSTLATYTSGNDSITLKNVGHHYYICGVPGHCAGGQKVDILVSKSGPSTAPVPPSAPLPTPPTAPVPTPPKPNGTSTTRTGLCSALAMLGVAAMSGLLVAS